MLARNVQHQGDDSRSMIPSMALTQLNSNDRPRTFSEDRRKVNFAISYLKGIALAHFENTLIEPDIFHPAAWDDNYEEFVSELKTYFGAPDIIGEAESKLENLVMKPNQHIAKYLVKFNRLASITGWDNCTLRH